ncbi:MAG: hypothetical protein H6807_03715 [Planctomycetes bacterium]|nr:hypothetical protein [Planctomycetota bacterium]
MTRDHEGEPLDERMEHELESARAELGGLIGRYRRDVLDQLEPSSRHRAAMHKMLLGLVTEDVLACRPRVGLATLLVARWRRFWDCWRELSRASLAFRLTSQLTLALGIGLVLSIATITSIHQGLRAEERRLLEEDRNVLPDGPGFELSIPAGREEELPVEPPAAESRPADSPFDENR